MTVTTRVRISWPVMPISLLDVASFAAGATDWRDIRRSGGRYDLSNDPGQNLLAWIGVRWHMNGDRVSRNRPAPPAETELHMDSSSNSTMSAEYIHGHLILPVVARWLELDRYRHLGDWWWEDEPAGTWHPSTTPVQALYDMSIPREVWTP